MEYIKLKEKEEQEQFDAEASLLYNMFPNAKFTISIDYYELDTVITRQPSIIAIQQYTCNCYNKNKRITEYYYVKGNHITNKFIIQTLIDQGFNPNCRHRFLEGFLKMKNSDFKFEIMMGS
jgi:hypothetical protein